MPWASKTKNSADTPSFKNKVATKYELGYLVTPDGAQILVGENEDLILIYQEEETFWQFGRSKTAGNAWSNRTKTPVV